MFLICGEALYDVFLTEEHHGGRLSFNAVQGGSPFNVAIGMARLEGKSALLTGLSHDMFGERLFNELGKEKVTTDYLVRNDHRTTLSVIGLDAKGSPSYRFYGVGSADCSLTKADLPPLKPDITGLHFGSYSIAVKPTADAFFHLAKANQDKLISLDPNVRLSVEPNKEEWRKRITHYAKIASLIKISEEDIEALYPSSSLDSIAEGFLKAGVALVVVTRGGEGAMAFTKTFRTQVPSRKITVVDTVGAGDSFQASLLTDLQTMKITNKKELSVLSLTLIEAMLTKATLAASLTCQKRGADLPRLSELTPP